MRCHTEGRVTSGVWVDGRLMFCIRTEGVVTPTARSVPLTGAAGLVLVLTSAPLVGTGVGMGAVFVGAAVYTTGGVNG